MHFDHDGVDTIFCLLSICVPDPEKSKNIILSMERWEHPKWCDTTRLDIRAPEVPFLAKMTEMPLVNPRLTKG